MSSPNLQVCAVTFGDQLVFGAVSNYSEHTIMRAFFRALKALGITAVMATNDYDAEPLGPDQDPA